MIESTAAGWANVFDSDTIDAKMHAITAHASQFGGRGLDTEMYREFAHLQGRMVGVPYAEGLDVNRMLLS